MKARYRLAWFVVVLLSAAAPAYAQDRWDVRLAEEIAREVSAYSRFTIFDDVNARVENGVVALAGKVTMPFKKDEIGARVARIDGVREVDNRIEVLPVSPLDDQLRYRIARAIYGSPSFWRYAAMANPPIHIIVERGRVTLTGVVASHVERMLARSLATGWGELSVTSELRTDAEVRVEEAMPNSQRPTPKALGAV
ncbi:MAG TPA: BON domain-containing protein [Vicinamibacterales bacterium]|nr:BON domain-containing protein [Vicinamibacterales bacterium]